MKNVIYILIVFCIYSCTKADHISIDPNLQEYYDLFIEEANKRSVTLSPEATNVTMHFTDIPSSQVLGQCRYNPKAPNNVEIDFHHWNTFDDETKEFVVFHELGHCILDRDHRDDIDSSGRCESIMHSYKGLCIFEYFGSNREGYLDELFTY